MSKNYDEVVRNTDRVEGARLREVREKAGGPSASMSHAESGKNYTGRVVGMTDRHVVQEQKEKPGHLVAHDRQSLSGTKLEAGRDVEIRYPHGKAGLVKEAGREVERQQHHQVEKAGKQPERER